MWRDKPEELASPAQPVPNPPTAPISGIAQITPCPPGTGRVYEMKVIQNPDHLPAWQRVATDVYPDLVQRDEESRILTLLVRENEIAVLWTNRPVDREVFSDVFTRIKNHKLRMTHVFEASNELLSVFIKRTRNNNSQALAPITEGESQRLFQEIVTEAVKERASDIHLQIGKQFANVMFRIDGELFRHRFLERSQGETLSRTIFAKCDNDSKKPTFDPRVPQDASVSLSVIANGVESPYKLRYGSIPVYPDGWDITLRVLPLGQGNGERSVSELGYDSPQEHDIDRMLSRPSGLIVMCGTTGSGKSTTMQTFCGMIFDRNAGRKLIRTIENPPEYIIRGAQQTPSGEDTFLATLKACMRGDPDVIMVGEVRDEETAKLAQQAGQTGHKVLTTVHAGDTFEAVDRLIDLGMRRSVLASGNFVSGIIFQQLLPVLCPHCCLPIDEVRGVLTQDAFNRINRTSIESLSQIRFRGEGCANCSGRSIHGRTVAAEILMFDREIQTYILRDNPLYARAYWRSGALAALSQSCGRTALDQAMIKMTQGLVSPIDVEKGMGHLDDQEPVERARAWLAKNHGQPLIDMRAGDSRHD
jgi:general secretion pathway protein E